MIIAVTGHRPDKLQNEYNLKGPVSNWIRTELEKKVNQYRPDTMISRMALGVDTIWALLAIDLGIHLLAVLPFIGQEKKWPVESQNLYHKILAHKNTIVKVVCEPGYSPWKMQKGNEWMTNECDTLLGVWDGSDGGTKNCLDYAYSISKQVDIIDLKKRL